MEEEILCSSLVDSTVSVLQQPQQDSQTSVDHQYINGEQDAIVLGEREVEIEEAHGTDKLHLSPKTRQETPDEAEPWEPTIWSVRPMACASPPFSFATVQWDVPGDFTGNPAHVTDRSLASELDSDDVTSVDTTSSLFHQPEEDYSEPEEEREEQDGVDSRLLNLNREWTGQVSEPCDAADVQEPTTEEREDSPHELGDSIIEIPLIADLGEKDEPLVSSAPVETVDLINSSDEAEDSSHSDEEDGLVGSELDEEQEEPGVLLTGWKDSEDLQASTNGVEIEEEEEERGEEEEEKRIATNVCPGDSEEAEAVSCPREVEVSAEPLQTDDTGINLNSEKLQEEDQCSATEEDTETQEGPTGRTEEPEMCQDVDHDLEPEQAVGNDEETSMPVAENAEGVENVGEMSEADENQDFEQTTTQGRDVSPQPEQPEREQLDMTKDPEGSHQMEEERREDSDQLQHQRESPDMELTEQSTQESDQPEQAEEPIAAELRQQTETTEQNESQLQDADSSQPTLSDESEVTKQLPADTEVTQQTAGAGLKQVDAQDQPLHQDEGLRCAEDGDVANGEQPEHLETATPQVNGGEVDREMARRLAEQLFHLDGIQRVDVVKHLDKDNDFSHAVGEEYLKFFDFTGETLDHALRSFLKVVVVIGESQERERVLQHFACRFHQCNPNFSSSGAVLALTCALMLLNTDLHGQHVGKSMSSSKFVSNLDGMNEGENFSKDLLKGLYNSIKNEPLEWALDVEELKSSVLLEEDAGDDTQLRSKANPFLVVPHDKKAAVVKEGFLQRKIHADVDGKRTPWGKRGWKTFYGVLKGMVLYLQKDDYRREPQTNEEVVSVHHSLAEQASDYTKKPHVFRLQTADWRVFLFQASSKVEMNSWISRLNLVSALHSSPPFPAAVGSQRKFFRPILPASLSTHTLEHQLQAHTGMLESFKADLLQLQENPPEGRKSRTKELEEHRVRAEYLQYEICRYKFYIQVMEAWRGMEKTGNNVLSSAGLKLFDKATCSDVVGEEEQEEGGLKKSYSSPSLELEVAPPAVVKVRRNISERRTYRRTIIPRWNKEA